MKNGDVAKRWLKMAAEDFAGAEVWISAGITLAGACFHCQQVAEKSLKAWLILHDTQPPKTHELEDLLKLCVAKEPEFSSLTSETEGLTQYAIKGRYDADFWPSLDVAREALEQARRIYDFVKAHWS